jgi:hypothetical protein
MGWFSSAISSIGGGLGSVVHTVGSGLSTVAKTVVAPIYNKVVKPIYNKVIKPVGQSVGRIASKALNTGEHFITGGMDFFTHSVDKARGAGENLEDGAFNMSKLLKSPLFVIGIGIAGLIVVSKV